MKSTRAQVISDIEKTKIIAIIRGYRGETLDNICESLCAGGVKCAEITFDRSGKFTDAETALAIASLVKRFEGRMHIGAGTVMTVEQVRLTSDAGGEFIVSPDTFADVIRATRRLGLVSVPGAMTPSEASAAVRSGADFIKVFPCNVLPPEYIKAVCAPMADVKFLAVGGVTPDNLDAYMRAGARGIGIASGLFPKSAVDACDWKQIEERARRYVDMLAKY